MSAVDSTRPCRPFGASCPVLDPRRPVATMSCIPEVWSHDLSCSRGHANPNLAAILPLTTLWSRLNPERFGSTGGLVSMAEMSVGKSGRRPAWFRCTDKETAMMYSSLESIDFGTCRGRPKRKHRIATSQAGAGAARQHVVAAHSPEAQTVALPSCRERLPGNGSRVHIRRRRKYTTSADNQPSCFDGLGPRPSPPWPCGKPLHWAGTAAVDGCTCIAHCRDISFV